MKQLILAFMLTITSGSGFLSQCLVHLNQFSNIYHSHELTVPNTNLNDNVFSIEIEVKTIKQNNVIFSAPAVGAMLLEYYHEFTNVNQAYLAYQMHTNIGHLGTESQDFYQFMKTEIDNSYRLRWIPKYFGLISASIKYMTMQIKHDLQNNILPVIQINGTLTNINNLINHYLIINGIHGNLAEPWNITFEYLNSLPGWPEHETFSGRQLGLFWKDDAGTYFGLNPNF